MAAKRAQELHEKQEREKQIQKTKDAIEAIIADVNNTKRDFLPKYYPTLV